MRGDSDSDGKREASEKLGEGLAVVLRAPNARCHEELGMGTGWAQRRWSRGAGAQPCASRRAHGWWTIQRCDGRPNPRWRPTSCRGCSCCTGGDRSFQLRAPIVNSGKSPNESLAQPVGRPQGHAFDHHGRHSNAFCALTSSFGRTWALPGTQP